MLSKNEIYVLISCPNIGNLGVTVKQKRALFAPFFNTFVYDIQTENNYRCYCDRFRMNSQASLVENLKNQV